MTIFRKQTHQQRLPLFPIATGSATAPRLMPLGFIGYPHVAGIAALAVNVRLLKLQPLTRLCATVVRCRKVIGSHRLIGFL